MQFTIIVLIGQNGFELRTSDVGNDCSADCDAITVFETQCMNYLKGSGVAQLVGR